VGSDRGAGGEVWGACGGADVCGACLWREWVGVGGGEGVWGGSPSRSWRMGQRVMGQASNNDAAMDTWGGGGGGAM
jgi:hypothetical protein